MISYREALERVLALATLMPSEQVPLREALGRVLAEPVRAQVALPAFDYSAMDGYALRGADLVGEGPWELPVVGESRTGSVPPSLAAGSVCRIFTGAELPDGADCVEMQENVIRTAAGARLERRPVAGAHIRRRGEDLDVGAVALEAGELLGPAQLGLLAAVDLGQVSVRRRPRVTVVCTGDELRDPGSAPRPGTIPESNSFAVAAMARQAGAEVRVLRAAGDDRARTVASIREGLGSSDIFVSTGGVSVGDYDVVRPALEEAGAQIDFWKVAIKPGKPLVAGKAGEVVVLGLPGNPASAQVTFGLFGLPLIRRALGARQLGPRFSTARLGAPITQKPGRLGFYRARVVGEVATPLDGQASGASTSMAWADALVLVDADRERAEAGEMVQMIRLGDL